MSLHAVSDKVKSEFPRLIRALDLGIKDGKLLHQEFQEEALFRYYNKLKYLKIGNLERYVHTLRLLENYMALINNDFSTFTARMEHSTEDFDDLRELAVNSYTDDPLMMISCIMAHDYGTEDKTQIAYHFPISAEKCVPEFIENLRFTQSRLDTAKLIIGNHSYFGDLLLGEASFGYYQSLKNNILKTGTQQDFNTLILLNILDTHSGFYGSNLTKAHLDKYKEIISETIFNLPPEEQLKLRLSYLSNQIKPAKIDPTFHDVYLQYFYDLFTGQEGFPNQFFTEKINGRPLGESFINQLCLLWKSTNGGTDYTYITFQTGEMTYEEKRDNIYDKHCEMVEHSEKYLTADGNIAENCIDLQKRTFLGYPYEFLNSYLVIGNDTKDADDTVQTPSEDDPS